MKSKKSFPWGPGGWHELVHKKANIWLTTTLVLAAVVVIVLFQVGPYNFSKAALRIRYSDRATKTATTGAGIGLAMDTATSGNSDIPSNDPAIFAKHDTGPGAPVIFGNFRGSVGTVSLAVAGDSSSPVLSFYSTPGRDYDRLMQFIKSIPPKPGATLGTYNPDFQPGKSIDSDRQAGVETTSEFYKPEYVKNPPGVPGFVYEITDWGDGTAEHEFGGSQPGYKAADGSVQNTISWAHSSGMGPDHDLFYNHDTQKYEKAPAHKYAAPGNYTIKVRACYQSGPGYLYTNPFKLTKNPNRGARGQSDELPTVTPGPLDGRCSPEAKYLVRVVSRELLGDSFVVSKGDNSVVWRFGLIGPSLLSISETNKLSPPDYVQKYNVYIPPHYISGVTGIKLVNISNQPVTVSSVSWGLDDGAFARWQVDEVKLLRGGSVLGDIHLPLIHTAERETTSPCWAADNANRDKGGLFTFTPFTIQPGATEELTMDAHFSVAINCSGTKIPMEKYEVWNYGIWISGLGQSDYPQPADINDFIPRGTGGGEVILIHQ